MKKIYFWGILLGTAALFVLMFLAVARGQSIGPVAITSTQCAQIATNNKATAYVQVIGTWTGTLQPSAAIAGQAAANLQVTPSTSSTAQSTITANGAYAANVAGFSLFQVCGASVSSGTAKVFVNVSEK
jgi:hypothetical protein